MIDAREVAVTLSAPLLARLRAEARALGLPLQYLVAALVADTLDPAEAGAAAGPARAA